MPGMNGKGTHRQLEVGPGPWGADARQAWGLRRCPNTHRKDEAWRPTPKMQAAGMKPPLC